MDARQTQAEKADLKATQDTEHRTAAQQSAMRQSAAIHERDARTGAATPADVRFEQPEKDDKVVTTFRGQKVVTREEAADIVLQEKLEAAESEVGDDAIWYLLTKILKPEQILNLMVNCCGAAARAEEVEYNFEGQPYRFAEKETFKDDDESARARAHREYTAAKPKAVKGEKAVPEIANRYILDQIVLWTQSGNRP